MKKILAPLAEKGSANCPGSGLGASSLMNRSLRARRRRFYADLTEPLLVAFSALLFLAVFLKSVGSTLAEVLLVASLGAFLLAVKCGEWWYSVHDTPAPSYSFLEEGWPRLQIVEGDLPEMLPREAADQRGRHPMPHQEEAPKIAHLVREHPALQGPAVVNSLLFAVVFIPFLGLVFVLAGLALLILDWSYRLMKFLESPKDSQEQATIEDKCWGCPKATIVPSLSSVSEVLLPHVYIPCGEACEKQPEGEKVA